MQLKCLRCLCVENNRKIQQEKKSMGCSTTQPHFQLLNILHFKSFLSLNPLCLALLALSLSCPTVVPYSSAHLRALSQSKLAPVCWAAERAEHTAGERGSITSTSRTHAGTPVAMSTCSRQKEQKTERESWRQADTEPHAALYVSELQGQGQRRKPGLS